MGKAPMSDHGHVELPPLAVGTPVCRGFLDRLMETVETLTEQRDRLHVYAVAEEKRLAVIP